MAELSRNFNLRPRSPVKPNARKGALPRTPPKVDSPRAPSTDPTSSRHPERHSSDDEADLRVKIPEEDDEDAEDAEDDETSSINPKDLLLEIQRMKIEMKKAEKHHAAKAMALQNQLFQYQKSSEKAKIDTQHRSISRGQSSGINPHRQVSQAPLSPLSGHLGKVPHLPEEQKLASSINSDPAMWRHAMTTKMNRYENYFCDDIHRIEYIYENTKDDAAKFLRSYILNPPHDWTPQDFIDFVSDAFIDPAKRENATAEFERLMMNPRQLFWDFWKDFRTLAADAEYRDDRFLSEQLRSKVLIRLSNAVQTEWVRCRTLNDYVKVLQDADAHHQSTQHRQKRHAAALAAADERHSYFPSSSVTPKSQRQTVRSLNYKELNNSADNKSDNSVTSSTHPRSFHEPAKQIQRGSSVTPGYVEAKQRSQTPGRIYQISTDPHFETFEEEDLTFTEQNKSTQHVTQKKDEA